ncbi:hypothetical protein HHK36_016785 [Tetracentron sinense]|uniref:BZIP domain-containing protein n=1 Tax=Tetracentron sinense TaxID=13715 RepID=A0A834Z1Y5_TETSI|nr:hypothetical protein HHK36_016785 [Tetracentron sinense]
MAASVDRQNREEDEVSLQKENLNGERCSGSCSSSSSSSSSTTFSGGDSQCRADRMVKIELEAARALANFAQLALLKIENPSGESDKKWGNKGRRSRKRVKHESPGRDWGKNLESSETQSSTRRPSDLAQERSIDQQRHKKMCKNVIMKTVKVEQNAELPRPSLMSSTSCASFGGGKSRQYLTEDEKEARRLRRILANRESARQTIRRRQALCEELSRKAADLAWDNKNMKQSGAVSKLLLSSASEFQSSALSHFLSYKEKELAMKEFRLLEDTNKHLKAQMAKKIKAEVVETTEEPASTHMESPTSSSTKLPLLVYNGPPITPLLWPSIIQHNNPIQTQPVPQNAVSSKDPMPADGKLYPSHEQGSPLNLNGPRIPIYILTCPWFFPHGNGPHPHHPKSCGQGDNRDEDFNKQQDVGSSSKAMGNVEKMQPSLPIKVKTDASCFTEAKPTNNLLETAVQVQPVGGQLLGPHPKGVILMPAPLRSLRPSFIVKDENGLQPDSTPKEEAVPSTDDHILNAFSVNSQGLSTYPSKKLVDAAAAAEARKRRKELTKLKNLHGRQLRMHC